MRGIERSGREGRGGAGGRGCLAAWHGIGTDVITFMSTSRDDQWASSGWDLGSGILNSGIGYKPRGRAGVCGADLLSLSFHACLVLSLS